MLTARQMGEMDAMIDGPGHSHLPDAGARSSSAVKKMVDYYRFRQSVENGGLEPDSNGFHSGLRCIDRLRGLGAFSGP